MSNTSLVFLSEDQTTPVTSSEVIATALDKDHKDVLALAKKYEPDLEEFGPSSFKTKMVKIGSGAQRVKEIAILNESQATLLITYMRNSEKVRKFKIALVKAFFEMRKKIEERKDPKTEGITDKAKEWINGSVEEYANAPITQLEGASPARCILEHKINMLLIKYTYIPREFIDDLIKEKTGKIIDELEKDDCILICYHLLTLAKELYLCKINLYFKKKLFKGL